MSDLARAAAAGIALGAVWGVFLRVFMRLLVYVGAEFTWSGTLAIIGFAAAAGLGLALVRWARLSGRSVAWRAAGLLAAPLVIFPQGILVLLPAVLLGGLIISGRPPRWLRIVLAVVVLAPAPLAFMLVETTPMAMPLPIVLTVLYTLMITLAIAGAEVFRPWPAPRMPAPAAGDDAQMLEPSGGTPSGSAAAGSVPSPAPGQTRSRV